MLPYLLLLLGILTRLLPHPPNFAPIAAIAIFGGLYLRRREAIALPLIAMFASDLILGFYEWQIMASVYLSFAATGLIALAVRRRKNFATILGGTLAGSILFFLTTNAAVWLWSGMYSPTLGGLTASYLNALPFFRNSILGDLFYTGVLVGAYEAICVWQNAKKIPAARPRAGINFTPQIPMPH